MRAGVALMESCCCVCVCVCVPPGLEWYIPCCGDYGGGGRGRALTPGPGPQVPGAAPLWSFSSSPSRCKSFPLDFSSTVFSIPPVLLRDAPLRDKEYRSPEREWVFPRPHSGLGPSWRRCPERSVPSTRCQLPSGTTQQGAEASALQVLD